MAANWQEWEDTIDNCRACDLAKTRNMPLTGNKNYAARVMLLGEAPGREEDLCGKPFVGQAGAILDEFLQSTGLKREQLYIGNTVKCRPVALGKRGYKNRKPTTKEVIACRPHLLQEITLLQPALIVSLGAVPLSFLLGRTPKMAEEHGRLFHHQGFNVDVFAIYHPAALIYDPGKRPAYQADLNTLKTLLQERGLLAQTTI